MKTSLNFLIGIVAGLLVLAIPASAQDQSCSFSYTGATTSGISPGFSYLAKASSWTDTNSFSITLNNVQYLPTYLYAKTSGGIDSSTGLYVYYWKPNATGYCVQSTYYTARTNVGISGTVYVKPDSIAIGTWSLVKRTDDAFFAATYDISKLTSGQVSLAGKYLEYVIQSAWQSNELDCGIYQVRYSQPSLTVYAQPAGGSLESLLSNLQLVTSSRSIPLVLSNFISSSANSTVLVQGSFLIIRNVNISVTHDRISNVLITGIKNNFDGNVSITAYNGKEYSYPFIANQYVQYYIPHYGNMLKIRDSGGADITAFDLTEKLSCLNPDLVGLKKLRLVDLAGNQIMLWSVNITGAIYESNSNGYVEVDNLQNQSVTVYPLKRTDLAFTTTVSTLSDITTITARIYVYTLQIAVRQIDITGNPGPASFSYNITGQEYANKTTQTNPNFATAGNAFDNVTLYLLPGNYNIKLRTVSLIFTRENTTAVSLFDNNYYRKLVWTVGLTSDGFSQTLLTNPVLSVLVIDQNSQPVANAEVQIYDQSGNLLAPKTTGSNGSAVFSVQPGFNYTIRVYYANNLKAVRDIYFPADETTMHVTIPISITPEEKKAAETGNQTVISRTAETVNWAAGILVNPVVIALFIILLISGTVAKAGGTEIGLIAMIAGIGLFTFIIPVLPPQILAVIGVAAGVMFGLRIVRK
jgi:uncharacterized Tic20 family protein